MCGSQIPSVDDVIKNNAVRLYRNIFKASTPASVLHSVLLALFILKGTTINGTLLERIVRIGADPLDLITDSSPSIRPVCNTVGDEDGLLLHEDYNKPRPNEHILVTHLTKAY